MIVAANEIFTDSFSRLIPFCYISTHNPVVNNVRQDFRVPINGILYCDATEMEIVYEASEEFKKRLEQRPVRN